MENNYQLSRIHNYINGLMNMAEMHALEREALEDPFLQEAIEGYALQRGVDAYPLSILQKRLQDRISHSKQAKNEHYFTWQRLTIGSVAAVMFVVVCTFLLMRYISPPKTAITEVDLSTNLSGGVIVEPMFLGISSEGYPTEGWTSFNTYLVDHLEATSVTSTLIVTFDIDQQGIPTHFVIEGDVSGNLENRLKNMLTQGPLWEGSRAQIKIVPSQIE